MTKQRIRRQTDATVPTPFEEARDELFQQIMTCGVIGAEASDQHEWFSNTMQYLGDRYPELSDGEVVELRTLGQRFVQPPKAAAQDESRVLSGAA